MRSALLLAAVVLVSACGSGRTTHYDVHEALDCLQRTNSTRGGGDEHSIFLLFASDDGVSAVEPVFVSFGDGEPNGSVAAALGVTKRDPMWKERRGDAQVAGYGPYEPPVAKARGIDESTATAAAKTLDTAVRRAIDDCLKRNER